MGLSLFRMKYDPIVNWVLKGIPRGIYPLYKVWREDNPNVTEKELANALFNQRFSKTVFESTYQERARIKSYFEMHSELETLLDMSVASAMIEFKVPPDDYISYTFIKKIHSVELFKQGYRYKL